MSEGASSARGVHWTNVITVVSAAILIGTEIIGAGMATGWAIAGLFGLGEIGAYVLEGALRRRRLRRHLQLRPPRGEDRTVRRSLNAARATRVFNFRFRFSSRLRHANFFRESSDFLLHVREFSLMCASCPNSHVPVVACRSTETRTRGRKAVGADR